MASSSSSSSTPAEMKLWSSKKEEELYNNMAGEGAHARRPDRASGGPQLYASCGGDTARAALVGFRLAGGWGSPRAAGRAELGQFVAFVEARRATHPGVRIYHYAAYEVTALKRLTVRHGVGERELDDWLRAGLFVDLYSTVRAALRAGVPSYSIKKVERLYSGARSEEVESAADSVVQYAEWRKTGQSGMPGREEGQSTLLQSLQDHIQTDWEAVSYTLSTPSTTLLV